MEQRTDDRFDWSWTMSGSTSTAETGPAGPQDGTNGGYAFIEASSPRVRGDDAV